MPKPETQSDPTTGQAPGSGGDGSIAREREAVLRLDPVIDAARGDAIFERLREWREARLAQLAAVAELGRLEDAEGAYTETVRRHDENVVSPAHERAAEACRRVAGIEPTTAAGLVAQLQIGHDIEETDGEPEKRPLARLLASAAATAARLQTRPDREANAESDSGDPALVAFERWRQAREAELALYRDDRAYDQSGNASRELEAAEQAAMAAERALANTVATSPAGLAAQVRLAFRIFGVLKREHRSGLEPDDYEELAGLESGGGAELLRNMLAAAERMAGKKT